MALPSTLRKNLINFINILIINNKPKIEYNTMGQTYNAVMTNIIK